jgi:hypothetical protein
MSRSGKIAFTLLATVVAVAAIEMIIVIVLFVVKLFVR